MAKQIEYIHSSSTQQAKDSLRSRITWITKTPPAPADRLLCIRIDFLIDTEDVAVMKGDRAVRRWQLLAPGLSKPEGMDMDTAVVFAEAIWLDTIMSNVSGHPNVVSAFFRGALAVEADRRSEQRRSDSGMHLDWATFTEIGEVAGVDFRIAAWLDCVPLEHVLDE